MNDALCDGLFFLIVGFSFGLGLAYATGVFRMIGFPRLVRRRHIISLWLRALRTDGFDPHRDFEWEE